MVPRMRLLSPMSKYNRIPSWSPDAASQLNRNVNGPHNGLDGFQIYRLAVDRAVQVNNMNPLRPEILP